MKRIVRFGKRKFLCELKKVRVSGKQERYTEKVFCKEIKTEKNSSKKLK